MEGRFIIDFKWDTDESKLTEEQIEVLKNEALEWSCNQVTGAIPKTSGILYYDLEETAVTGTWKVSEEPIEYDEP